MSIKGIVIFFLLVVTITVVLLLLLLLLLLVVQDLQIAQQNIVLSNGARHFPTAATILGIAGDPPQFHTVGTMIGNNTFARRRLVTVGSGTALGRHNICRSSVAIVEATTTRGRRLDTPHRGSRPKGPGPVAEAGSSQRSDGSRQRLFRR